MKKADKELSQIYNLAFSKLSEDFPSTVSQLLTIYKIKDRLKDDCYIKDNKCSVHKNKINTMISKYKKIWVTDYDIEAYKSFFEISYKRYQDGLNKKM